MAEKNKTKHCTTAQSLWTEQFAKSEKRVFHNAYKYTTEKDIIGERRKEQYTTIHVFRAAQALKKI